MKETQYYDLHITGMGYLNRAREVAVRKNPSFLAVDITAIHGEANELQKTRFDCRVMGAEAQDILRLLMPHIEAGQKVLVGFRLGDLYAETFIYKGEKAGQTGVSLKARLLQIIWVKVDGQPFEWPKDDKAAA